jgi:hypothetical protein
MWETNLKFQKIIKNKWQKINYHPTWQAFFGEWGGTSPWVGARGTPQKVPGTCKMYQQTISNCPVRRLLLCYPALWAANDHNRGKITLTIM